MSTPRSRAGEFNRSMNSEFVFQWGATASQASPRAQRPQSLTGRCEATVERLACREKNPGAFRVAPLTHFLLVPAFRPVSSVSQTTWFRTAAAALDNRTFFGHFAPTQRLACFIHQCTRT